MKNTIFVLHFLCYNLGGDNMNEEIMRNMRKYNKLLGEYATKDEDAIRIDEEIKDIRPNYFRDIDRIIFSLSYSRYLDKTQVFSNMENDHISKRITHVQMVSKIARTIGRALNMNEDLIEAIALGHDLGHVPFGHAGEAILNRISLEYTGKYFSHNVHSVRILKDIENNGSGENISLQVLDGILCHNGESVSKEYHPTKRNLDEFLQMYENCYTDSNTLNNLNPMTLEGCIVRISDLIGYIGRDIEDAIRLELLSISDIPSSITEVLGTTNNEIVNTIILDIIGNSLNQNYIKMSDKIYNAIKELKNFNYENIYYKANSVETLKHFEEMYETLFKSYLNDIKNKNVESEIYQVFLGNMIDSYLITTSDEQKVIDFIAGMTDDYFTKLYNKCVNSKE